MNSVNRYISTHKFYFLKVYFIRGLGKKMEDVKEY